MSLTYCFEQAKVDVAAATICTENDNERLLRFDK